MEGQTTNRAQKALTSRQGGRHLAAGASVVSSICGFPPPTWLWSAKEDCKYSNQGHPLEVNNCFYERNLYRLDAPLLVTQNLIFEVASLK